MERVRNKYIKNKKTVLISMILILALLVRQPMDVQSDETKLRLYAKSAVLMDADSGRVLY